MQSAIETADKGKATALSPGYTSTAGCASKGRCVKLPENVTVFFFNQLSCSYFVCTWYEHVSRNSQLFLHWLTSTTSAEMAKHCKTQKIMQNLNTSNECNRKMTKTYKPRKQSDTKFPPKNCKLLCPLLYLLHFFPLFSMYVFVCLRFLHHFCVCSIWPFAPCLPLSATVVFLIYDSEVTTVHSE